MKLLKIFLIILIFMSGYLHAREITIGGLFDLSGPTSKVATPYFQGVRDYFTFVNRGHTLPWIKIKFIYRDTKYNPSLAYKYADELIKKGAVAIIGWGTGSSFKIKPLVEKNRVVYIPASLCEKLLEPPDNHFIFIPAGGYATEINTIIKFLHRNKKYSNLSVGIITNPSKFGMEPMNSVKKYAEGKVKIDFIYPLPLKPSRTDLEKLRNILYTYRSPVLIIHSVPGPFVKVINMTKSIPHYTPIAFFGTFYTYTHKIIDKINKDLLVKVYTINHFALWYESTTVDTAMIRFFYEKNYRTMRREVYYTEGMVNAMIITLALQKIKGDVTGEKLKNTLESFKNVSTMGLTPPVSFSPRDHIAVEKLRVLKINPEKKTFIPITSWINP